MFYLNEIKFRSKYFLLSLFLTIGIFYNFSDLLLFLLLHKMAAPNSDEAEIFIYSNPAELLDLHILIVLFFSSLFLAPQLLRHFSGFFKSSLTLPEYSLLSKTSALICASIIYFNLLLCLFFFPKFWVSSVAIVNISNFFSFELTLREYFATLQTLLFQANLCFFAISTVYISLAFFELQIIFHLYRFYLLINILTACVLTSSEFHGQFYILFFLIFFLEFVFLFSILNHKIRKYLKLLSRHYVK
jgi:hypothetical protein